MARNHLKGMNDIPNRMSRPRGNGGGRAQNAALLARLEQQKALLEKQLQVWVKQKTITEERLRIVGVQIRAAQQALRVPRSRPAAVSQREIGASGSGSQAAPARHRGLEFTF
jgi:hypothetical protein